jgi:hypothetical protein
MFGSLRPKPPPPLPLPFRNRRAEREAERRKAMERFANIEMDRAPGFSWNSVPEPLSGEARRRRFWKERAPAAGLALLVGCILLGSFVALSRVGLRKPGPTIIYVEDWSGRPDLDAPVAPVADRGPDSGPDGAAEREAGLARERAAARAATVSP